MLGNNVTKYSNNKRFTADIFGLNTFFNIGIDIIIPGLGLSGRVVKMRAIFLIQRWP